MSKPSSGFIVRFCLIALPVGITLLGIFSMTWSAMTGTLIHSTETESESPLPGPASLPKSERTGTLENWVNILSNRIGERHAGQKANLDATRYWIQSTLGINNIGYEVKEKPYEAKGETWYNLEVELPGTEFPEEIVIIGAHYDSAAGTPGANDNATGVAALLSLASSFHETPQPRTIRFVAFVNEESPWFQTADMGSLRYAKELSQGKENVVAMIALESLGCFLDEPGSQQYPEAIADRYPDTGNFLAFVGNPKSEQLVERAWTAFRKNSNLPAEMGVFPPIIQGVSWSDHWSFWEHGFPAIMVTDTALFRDANYHQPTDTVEHIDFSRYALAVDGLEHVIRDVARGR